MGFETSRAAACVLLQLLWLPLWYEARECTIDKSATTNDSTRFNIDIAAPWLALASACCRAFGQAPAEGHRFRPVPFRRCPPSISA